jgi:hypothetical protein
VTAPYPKLVVHVRRIARLVPPEAAILLSGYHIDHAYDRRWVETQGSDGLRGYAETPEALSDPVNENHEQALDIYSDDYDLHARLQTLTKKWAPRQRTAK